jgi:hypothetical protein
MINRIFDACVFLLVTLAEWLGISYEAVNVWIFVALWPFLTLCLVAVILVRGRALRRRGR